MPFPFLHNFTEGHAPAIPILFRLKLPIRSLHDKRMPHRIQIIRKVIVPNAVFALLVGHCVDVFEEVTHDVRQGLIRWAGDELEGIDMTWVDWGCRVGDDMRYQVAGWKVVPSKGGVAMCGRHNVWSVLGRHLDHVHFSGLKSVRVVASTLDSFAQLVHVARLVVVILSPDIQ